MSDRVQKPANAGSDDQPGQTGGAAASATSDDVAEASPTGLQVADTWSEAADQTGTVKAGRQVPAPDSLGG